MPIVRCQNSETNERTHLLQHPINSSPAVIANNGDLLRDNQNSVPQKNESNALNRIVQDFATYVFYCSRVKFHFVAHFLAFISDTNA